MTFNRKADTRSLMRTKVCPYDFNYTVYKLLGPFSTIKTLSYYLSQWFPVQDPHTSTAILFVTS